MSYCIDGNNAIWDMAMNAKRCIANSPIFYSTAEYTAVATQLSALQGSASAASTSSLTVAELFAVPSSPDLATIFMQGFSLPLICYLVAWAYGLLISFIGENHE